MKFSIKYFFIKVKKSFWIFEETEHSFRMLKELEENQYTITDDKIILVAGQDIPKMSQDAFLKAQAIIYMGNGCTFLQRDAEEAPNRWSVWNSQEETVKVLFGSIIPVKKSGISCLLLVGRETQESPVMAFLGDIGQI